MTVVERRTLAPQILAGKRRIAALAGLMLTASIALFLWRLAPSAPAFLAFGVAGLSGLSVVGRSDPR
jgi:uncharacterized membrane protein YdjX (TVP38/TMEM64 family)